MLQIVHQFLQGKQFRKKIILGESATVTGRAVEKENLINLVKAIKIPSTQLKKYIS